MRSGADAALTAGENVEVDVDRRSPAGRETCRRAGARVPCCGWWRELRLDLFRGLALWLIYIDHLPTSVLTWFTIRNYGFSDATEIFIFIAGYTGAFVYARAMGDRGIIVASARIFKRVWQIYAAHILLFMAYLAEISYVATRFENPLYAEEMNVLDFFKQPDVTIVQALLLKFRPVNMDVLPLYIVLLAFFPLILLLMRRKPDFTLLLSVGLYIATWEFDLTCLHIRRATGSSTVCAAAAVRVRRVVRRVRRMSRLMSSVTLSIAIVYLSLRSASR